MTSHRVGSREGTNLHRLSWGVALSLCALACHGMDSRSRMAEERPDYELRSGKHVADVRIGCRLAPPSGPLTVYVDYEAPMPRRDYQVLALEAIDLWADFRNLAEARGAKALMVRAYDSAGQKNPVDFAFYIDRKGDWLHPEVRALSTGKRVLILRAEMKDSGHFFIDYISDIPLRDVCALRPEVDAVWGSFREVAQELGATKGLVTPTDAPVGGATITFSFSRIGDRWSGSDLCGK